MKQRLKRRLGAIGLLLWLFVDPAAAEYGAESARKEVAVRTEAIHRKLQKWRRDIHAHPELGDAEFRTAKLVAEHLKTLGLEVRAGVARTGVVGVLKGGKPGPVIALRADMDALPVKENSDLPFASKARGKFRGQEVDVMHACGHDAHTAILMAVAEVLAGMRERLPGVVAFYFQPAEEGPSDFLPDGTGVWGAKMMVREGVMNEPRPEAIFGLHVWAGLPAGRISYRTGPTTASSDDMRIDVVGRQTHAGRPWDGVDPITVSAQIVLALQTIISRQTDISSWPSVISIGAINGGTTYNIIPESVSLIGTIRSYDQGIRKGLQEKVKRTVENVAASAGAKGVVSIVEKYDPTINDETLTEKMLPTLQWAAKGDVVKGPLPLGSEDFSFFAKEVPGLFFLLGVTPRDQDPAKAAPNHHPGFYVDESALATGVKALAGLATDYLFAGAAIPPPVK